MYNVLEAPYTETQRRFLALGIKSALSKNPHTTINIKGLMEDLDNLLVIGDSSCYTAAIAEVMVDPAGDNYFFIWAIYSLKNSLDIDACAARITDFASFLGCKYIESATERGGWAPVLEKLGATSHTITIYRKDLTDGVLTSNNES